MQKLLKLFDGNIGKYLLTAILLVVPLFPKFPAFRIPGTYVAVRLEDFLILFTLSFFAIPLLKNIKSIFNNNVSRSILIFLGIGLVSLISGIYLTQSVELKIGLLHWFRRVEYLSLFYMAFIYVRSNKDSNLFFDYVIKILLIINLLVFAYGVGQKYLEFPVIVTQNEEYSKGIALRWVPGAHINSTFAGHYDLASFIVLIVPTFITAFFVLKDKASKVILGLSTFFGFWLLSVAVSRISIVAFIIAVSVSLLLYKKFKEIILFGIISVIIFGTAPDLQVRYKRIFDVVKQRLSTVVVVQAQENGNVNEDRSTSIRLNVEWPRAIRAFTKNPILGTGYSSITLATDNDYLRALGETGAFGLLSFLLIFIYLYQHLKNYVFDNSIKSIFIAGYIGSTIGIIMTAIFIDIFEASKFAIIYWMFTGLVVGSLKNKHEQIN
ncbi:O-antigen ligase family protein [Candidatus Dojkabacteria bacterium]|nr:O-antigen ligase family protein [Candidatus Dojkabacteria bacterium]